MDADSSVLFLLGSTPVGGARLRAGVDAVLAFAVFGREPTVLFCHDAVLALCPRAGATDRRAPDLRRQIDSFPLYDLETVWVDQASLATRGIAADRLPAFARIATARHRRTLLQAATAVLAF